MLMHLRTIGVRAAGVLVGLLALTLITTPTSNAATRTLHDATKDVYVADLDQQQYVRSSRPNGDITAVRIDHRARTVKIVVSVRQLRSGFNSVFIEVATSANRHRDYMLAALRMHGRTETYLTRGAIDNTMTCQGLRVRFDPAHAKIRATIPTRCIGDPGWVRVGAMVITSPKKAVELQSFDVAGKTVINQRWWTHSKHLPLSGKVYLAKIR